MIYVHEAKGKILQVPRTNVIVVPYEQRPGGFTCVVVRGNESYPVGGYDILVSDADLKRSIEVALPDVWKSMEQLAQEKFGEPQDL